MTCIVCGERATRYLWGQPACAHCVRLSLDDEETFARAVRGKDLRTALDALARRFPSLAKKMKAMRSL